MSELRLSCNRCPAVRLESDVRVTDDGPLMFPGHRCRGGRWAYNTSYTIQRPEGKHAQ